MLAVALAEVAPWAALVAFVTVCLLVDLLYFARGREPTLREGVIWSIGWIVLSLLAALVVLVIEDADAAVNYTTVYLIERSLSLDNLFVFLVLFGYFGVPTAYRGKLLFGGIAFALVLRGLAILGGIALIEQFHFVVYVLGVLLLVLAFRLARGVEQSVHPDRNMLVRATRRLIPVTSGYREGHWFVRESGRRYATPLFVALVALVAADLAFAVDSIPAAFAITREPLIVWMGNAFALLGLRALFVLVEGLMRRFRYLDETIAVVLGLVAIKLLTEDVYRLGPLPSLAVIGVAFAAGIAASLIVDRRDPHAAERRNERARRVEASHAGTASRR
jgi:tellurite resistance protein TerC